MIPQSTCFNGSGSEHTFANYNVPYIHYVGIKNRKGTHHLVVMDVSKNKVVHAWYSDKEAFRVGIRKHSPVIRDKHGRYFIVYGRKVFI